MIYVIAICLVLITIALLPRIIDVFFVLVPYLLRGFGIALAVLGLMLVAGFVFSDLPWSEKVILVGILIVVWLAIRP